MSRSIGIKRVLVGLVIALAMTGLVQVSSAGSAMAATCSGYGCDNQDPVATGCSSGAYTVATEYSWPYYYSSSPLAKVEMRYSPSCGTNWVRTTSYSGSVIYMNAAIKRQGTSTPMPTESGWYTTMWTNMVYAPTPIKACGQGQAGDGGLIGWDWNWCF